MPSTLDFYRSANEVIKQHGEDATAKAAMRADELLEAGDIDGCSEWKQILVAIQELQRGKPGDGEAVH